MAWRWIVGLAVIAGWGSGMAVGTGNAQAPPLFPFVLPWDDRSPGITNISGWHHHPAGKFGPIRISTDGHLAAGVRRIRFLGVNLDGGACFPRPEDAERIADRMAKFGINIVRLHHFDQPGTFPQSIRPADVPHTRDLDPEALDRLDGLIARLKQRGIYVNLNLLVSRPFNAADGLPPEIERVSVKTRHAIGFFFAPLIELQKEYARKLLTHRNPDTEMIYAEDPAVAFVEINNENGLILAWLQGQVDRMPEVFLRDLQRQWNAWLQGRYGTTAALRQAWHVKQEPLGAELGDTNNFAHGLGPWVLEQHGTAQATATVTDEGPEALRSPRAARITVTEPSSAAWHVQLHEPGLQVQAGRPDTLSFWARADRPCTGTVALMQAHDPWQNLGFRTTVQFTTRWRHHRFVFSPRTTDENARLTFSGLAHQAASYWLAGISLRPGGTIGLSPDERLESGTAAVFTRVGVGAGERTAAAHRDWLQFLWQTEEHYWQALYRYLKYELKVRALVIGTAADYSTPNLMAGLDVVDAHAYWQHPIFPGRSWDPDNWVVPDRTMVNARGGTLPGLALRRVAGKPFSVTEYSHPAPNTYAAEGFLLLAAYAALQDWDAVYAFDYSARCNQWNERRIPNFFDIDQHPTKMITLVPAAAMFLRGDVEPARRQIVVLLNPEREIALLHQGQASEMVHAGQVGVPREAALIHHVAIATDSRDRPTETLRPGGVKLPDDRFIADTGELVWDLSEPGRGVVTVNTARSKAVVGFGGGKHLKLGGVVIEPGGTTQEGWSAITVTVMSGAWPSHAQAGHPMRLLITAVGSAENTGMRWKDPQRSSVGRHWGRPPSLVEGIPAHITLPLPARRTESWALDEQGQRASRLPIHSDANGNAVLMIGSRWRTLWYEVMAR